MITAPLSNKLPIPRYRYSPVIQAGAWFTFSGMIALDLESGTLVAGGPEMETTKILANLTAALPDFGLQLADIISARIFTTRFEEFSSINSAWDRWIGESRPPARTSLGVVALPLNATVEIEFVFYRNDPQ